jgi:hypothetical protein
MSAKICFVIAPIGEDSSPERKKVDSIIKDILQPTLGKEYEVKAAHQITKPGIITSQIVEMIFNSDLIVCDLTGVNGNVMYELAIAHLKEKQVLIIATKDTDLPFDISHQRVIFYDNNISGSFGLKREIEEAIIKIKDEPSIDNPITAYLNQSKTSLVSEQSIMNTVKEAIIDAVTTSQTTTLAGDKSIFVEEIEKNLNKAKTDKFITSYLETDRLFNASKFYNAVSSFIERGHFPVKVDSIKTNYPINNYVFEYKLRTKDYIFLIKIANTISNIGARGEASRIINAFDGITEIESYGKNKIQPILIIPSEVVNPGKLVKGKIPLLKYDIRKDQFSNWQVVLQDLTKIHKESIENS